MADRLLRVNAYTTLDLADAEVRGHGWREEAFAVVNATSAREEPTHVELQLELDEIDELPAHAETVRLSPEEARTLAAELERHATRVEDA
ncbi:DUF6360 family protein [Natronorarus salvus]|uniref:DUF6360 family protein n=1 Tax=Natronorarus salvus TaxID=3117733 RepID=UPI002F26A926